MTAKRAKISVFDRGLLYGDGLFETMRAYRGRVFALHEHIERMRRSAAFLDLDVPARDWTEVLGELLRRNRLCDTDAWIRLNLTRGPAEPDVAPPPISRPTDFVLVKAVAAGLRRVQRMGVEVTVLPFSRQGFSPQHKSLNYMSAVVGKALARERGAYEGLYRRDGKWVTEGTTSSVFSVRGRTLLTPVVDDVLPGVTRKFTRELGRAAGLRVIERNVTVAALQRADEVFLTSSVAEIVPVIAMDGRAIGDGRPGATTRDLQRRYRARVRRELREGRRADSSDSGLCVSAGRADA